MAWDHDDEYEDRENDCDHQDYEIDVCTGRAECSYCSVSWYVSQEDVNRELDRQADYYEAMERENRRQWWRDLFAPVVDPFRHLLGRLRRQPAIDDDIPF